MPVGSNISNDTSTSRIDDKSRRRNAKVWVKRCSTPRNFSIWQASLLQRKNFGQRSGAESAGGSTRADVFIRSNTVQSYSGVLEALLSMGCGFQDLTVNYETLGSFLACTPPSLIDLNPWGKVKPHKTFNPIPPDDTGSLPLVND